jgi:site-specific recombinase XerD
MATQNLPIDTAVEQYVTSRADATQSTRERHRYRFSKFTDYCSQADVTHTSQIDGSTIEGFRQDRLADDNTSIKTNEQCLHTFRVFLRYLERVEACSEGLSEVVIIPKVPDAQESRETHILHERARQIIDYLAKYEWANIKHVVFHLTYHTGLRRGALYALDVQDWDSEESCEFPNCR